MSGTPCSGCPYFLSVIFRHFHVLPLPADVIGICQFRVFSLKNRTKPAHIAVGNTRKRLFYIFSSLLLRGRGYLRRSHRRLLMNQAGVAAILPVQFPQFLFAIDVRFVKSVHRSAAQIVAAIAKIACPAALAQPLLHNADSFFSCGVLDQYTFSYVSCIYFLCFRITITLVSSYCIVIIYLSDIILSNTSHFISFGSKHIYCI